MIKNKIALKQTRAVYTEFTLYADKNLAEMADAYADKCIKALAKIGLDASIDNVSVKRIVVDEGETSIAAVDLEVEQSIYGTEYISSSIDIEPPFYEGDEPVEEDEIYNALKEIKGEEIYISDVETEYAA